MLNNNIHPRNRVRVNVRLQAQVRFKDRSRTGIRYKVGTRVRAKVMTGISPKDSGDFYYRNEVLPVLDAMGGRKCEGSHVITIT